MRISDWNSDVCSSDLLARELTLDPLVALVAAQPTRGLDINAVEAVYRQIRAAARRGVGVLLISSELDELIAVADRIVVLYRGQLVGERPALAGERAALGGLSAGTSRRKRGSGGKGVAV